MSPVQWKLGISLMQILKIKFSFVFNNNYCIQLLIYRKYSTWLVSTVLIPHLALLFVLLAMSLKCSHFTDEMKYVFSRTISWCKYSIHLLLKLAHFLVWKLVVYPCSVMELNENKKNCHRNCSKQCFRLLYY